MKKFSPHHAANRDGRPSSSFRLVLLVLAVAGFLLVPVSQAAAVDFPLNITTDGSGEGTFECDVEGGGAEPCEDEYEEGTELSLIAEPETGSEFVEFYGDCGPGECELTMDEEHNVTITFEALEEFFPLAIDTAGNGTGEVECDVEGGGAEPCEEEYLEGTELTLVANPDPGSEFVEWIGDCDPEDCELTMDEEHSVTALFELEPEEFDLEINFDGSGTGDVECEAQEGPEECAAEYPEGTELTLIPVADEDSEFAGFSDDCTGLTCELTMDEDKSVTATFEEEGGMRDLDINIVGEGEVECEVDGGDAELCEDEYEAGTDLSLVATPETGFDFDGYSAGTGSASACTGLTCDFTINADSSVTATFEPEAPAEFDLDINIVGEGEVECEVDGGDAELCEDEYEAGTDLSLVATPETGFDFDGYSAGTGSASACTGLTCDFTINADSSVTATFEPEAPAEFDLDINIVGEGEVECEVDGGDAELCEDEYEAGTDLSLVATPETGFDFDGYSAGTGSASACTGLTCDFTINADSSVTATFEPEAPAEFDLDINIVGEGEGEVECEVDGGDAELCEDEYEAGTDLSLVATPETGFDFDGYSAGTGSASACTGLTCDFTINADSSVTATFEPTPRTLTVTKAGTGDGTIQCKFNGGAAGACTSPKPNGTTVEIIATPNGSSTFTGFSGGTGSISCTGPGNCSFTLNANSTVTATFTLIQRTLTVTKAGTGDGTIQCKFNGGAAGACTSPKPSGTTVEIIATANAGSTFAGYSAGTGSISCTGTGNCSFTLNANSAVTATFNLTPVVEEFALTVVKAGSGSGSVTCDGGACAAKYAKGTKVALAASAASGSTFSGWSGGGCSGTGGCTVTIEADTTVTATFTADPPPPTEGKVKAAGSAQVKSGKANLKLTCTGGPCKGTLTLKAKVKQGKKTKNLVIGKASFSLAEGATATLKVKLSGPAKQELAKGKTVKATASGTGVTSSKVKLKPPKKK